MACSTVDAFTNCDVQQANPIDTARNHIADTHRTADLGRARMRGRCRSLSRSILLPSATAVGWLRRVRVVRPE